MAVEAEILGNVLMKKITQLVALIVALLLAGQTALAEVPCNLWLSAVDGHAPECCIGTSHSTSPQFSSNCHQTMGSEPITTELNQSGCGMSSVNGAAQAVTPAKSRAERAAAIVAVGLLPIPSAIRPQALSLETSPARGPSKYLLFQVFRI